MQFTDSSHLDGVEALFDIRGFGIGESSGYASFRAEQGQLKRTTAGQLRCTRRTARPPRASTASTSSILRMTSLARSNLLFCRSGLWLARTRARFSGSASAVSESCLLGSMKFSRLSRAIVRCPTWIATTTSGPRRPWACSAQGSAACGVMRPFSPGATPPWIAAAGLLACSHPPPAPRVRAATPVLALRITVSSTPSPRTRGAVFAPVLGGRTGMSASGLGSVLGRTCLLCYCY